jgi:hypothetical protein
MPNILSHIRGLLLFLILVAAFTGHRAYAQSWTVNDSNGDPVQVDHNADGSWTVTPQGGASNTYGADSAGDMVGDYGISPDAFQAMQAQTDGANGDENGNADNDGGGGGDGSEDNGGSMNGDGGGSDDGSGDTGGGGESGGGGGEGSDE